MKTIVLLGLLLMSASAFADSCYIPPIPPLGCSRDRMYCVCDSNGNCQWIFDCGRR